MNAKKLDIFNRQELGKSANRTLRREKKVPVVLFGHNFESKNFYAEQKDVEHFLVKGHVGSTLFVKNGGEESFVVLKSVQTHPVSQKVLHLGFQLLKESEAFVATVPIFIHGKQNLRGVLCQEFVSELPIEALPKDFVSQIDITLENPKSGDQLTVGELEIFKNGKVKTSVDPNTVIYLITTPRVQEETVSTSDEAKEPELIQKPKEEK